MTIDDTVSLDPISPVRGSPIRWLILGGALLIAAVAIGTATMAGDFRERALQNSERELENIVLLLARHLDQQLEEFEAVQKDLTVYMSSTGIASNEAYERQMSSKDTHEMLRVKSNGTPDVAGINIFDRDGTLINSSRPWPLSSVNIADRDFFKAFKSGSASGPSLIALLRSRFTGVWTVVIARKIAGPDGAFLGVVTRGIAPASFEDFFASVALGKNASIALFHQNGTQLARYPHVEALMGSDLAARPTYRRIFSGSDHGTTRLKSPVDGWDRLISVRRLSHFPLTVLATTRITDALNDWREQIRFLVELAGLFVLVIVVMLFFVVRKLSQQYQFSKQRLMLEKHRLDTAVNNMSQGLLLFDSSERLVVSNQRYIEMYGLSPQVMTPGRLFRDVIAHRKASGSFVGDVDEYCSDAIRDITTSKAFVIETAAGRSIQIQQQPVPEGGWVATHEDITERRRSDERIAHLAHYDTLTDLPNRMLFREQLKRELARMAPAEQLAVFYIDIDEFKGVNDSLGHLVGDELLKSVAASLCGCIGANDFVARLGGDEFAIVQTAVQDRGSVVDLADRVYRAIREPYQCFGHQVTADASIGIALAPQHGSDLDQILMNADLAMYAAKAAGRRTWKFFEPEMEARVKARRILEQDLRHAMAGSAFEVHYQPCVSLRDNAITGCEALLRWRHPERGMIPPAEFIPIAEETGLINQLGEWVLNTACAEAAAWPQQARLAVNVSPVQFRSGTLALKVVSALEASGLAANRLELEITEAVLIRDDDAALAILHRLRDIGVHIALDDFGTGYSSLAYLKRFPFDKIKIDRCFVSDIAEPDGSSSIVQAVVNIATARHMTTTAEGVETQQQMDLLRELGCTEMQGYLFSPARSAAEIRQLLLSHLKHKAVA